ncbi:MAG: hypothetical protein R3E10_10855 [Gemmatimonadota bacterium]
MVRTALALATLLLSGSTIAIAWLLRGRPDLETARSILVNLGTEFFGIVVTVAVVDWLFERRRLHDRARELAWSFLHDIERVVRVWQGGPPGMETDELLGLISSIEADDKPSESAQALLVHLGHRSKELMDKEPRTLALSPALRAGLTELLGLRSLRDGSTPTSVRMVAEILDQSSVQMSRVLGLSTQRFPAGLIRFRDPTPEAQERRYLEIRSEMSA